jgi:hypothetical protein
MRLDRTVVLIAAAVLAAACSDSTGPNAAEITLSVQTTGLDLDADGYEVVVTGGIRLSVPVNGTARIHVVPGSYTIELAGLAPNCALAGPPTSPVTLGAGETLDLTAQVSCTATTGVIEVGVLTSGLDMDPDGYRARVDGLSPTAAIGLADTVRFAGMAGGSHTVTLQGTAGNCAVTGLAARNVTVTVGGLTRDTVRAGFDVTCVATTGVALVSVTTSGLDPDPDGYTLTIDALGQLLAPNAQADLSGLLPGDHQLELTGVAFNCAVAGPNPRTLTVTAGGLTRDTVRTSFDVSCTTASGAVRVTAPTTGPDPDADYVLQVATGYYNVDYYPLAAGGSQTLSFYQGTAVSVYLGGVAQNCAVAGPNPATVIITAGVTTDVTFPVQCVALGTIRITAPTTGSDPDDGYDLGVWDGSYYGQYYRLAAGGELLVQYPGGSSVQFNLGDVAPNCQVTVPSSLWVTVTGGVTTDVVFPVSCIPLSSAGTIRVTTATTGPDADTYYGVYVSGPSSFGFSLGGNGSYSFQAYPWGPFTISLTDVAANCTVSGSNPVTVTVTSGVTTDVVFNVTCVPIPPPGSIRVSAPTTGPNPDTGYDLYVDDGSYYPTTYRLGAGGSITLSYPAGVAPSFFLGDVAANCSVTGANPAQVTVVSGVTTDLTFNVVCQ